MTTEPLKHSSVVWVTVENVQRLRTLWTYRLSEDKPDSSRDGTLLARGIPTDWLCHSYTELCVWLQTYGCAPPPPDYFAPTPEELDEGAESILRKVMRAL